MNVYIMLKTKSYGVILVVALSAILGTGIVLAQTTMTIEIGITPATLNLYDVVDKCVTVHADIDYTEVDLGHLELNGIPAIGTKEDNCGNLVVKFNRADVARLVWPNDDTLELTLTGETNEMVPTAFTGTDTISVKQ